MKTVTTKQVAEVLQVAPKTVLRLVKRGKLKALPNMFQKRFTEGEVARFLGTQLAPRGRTR